MPFPEFAGFRVTLKSMLDRQDMGAIKANAEASKVPFGVGIIDGDIRWVIGGGASGRRHL